MSLATTHSAALLDTILARLAVLFLSGAGGNSTAAREAAHELLAAYDPETNDELRLAANIISFSLHTLEALSQAAEPAMSLNQKLRLRGSAVSLSRESHKAQRQLDHLQKARRDGTQPQPQSAEPPPRIEKAIDLIETTREVMTTAKATGQTWTQAYQQRLRDKRLAKKLQKNQARLHDTPAIGFANPTPSAGAMGVANPTPPAVTLRSANPTQPAVPSAHAR